MGLTILLTGEPQSGKTTLIKRLVSRLSCTAGGFYTQEILDRGSRQGFRIVTLDGQEAILAHIDFDSPQRVSRYGVDVSIVDSVAAHSIQIAIREKKVVIIDEIGPMELFSECFCKAVTDALESPAIVLGTIVKRQMPFADGIKSLPNVIVIEVSDGGLEATELKVLDLLSRSGCGPRVESNT